MTRVEVIKGLECVVADMQEEVNEWRDYSDSELVHGLTCDCDWWYNTLQKVRDALALLKTQEAAELVVAIEPLELSVDELKEIMKESVVYVSDRVDVVRCHDCKWWDKDQTTDGIKGFCPNTGCCVQPDFYCADGERRDGDT